MMRRKGKGRKLAVPRGITATQNQFCKVVETIAFQDVLPGVQPPDSFNLMEFSRARFMATGFQFYKAAKCTWTYYPLYNTFATDSAVTGDTVPYIYTAMNRTGDAVLPNTLQAFQAMGAKPVKFVNKHIVSYRPNWVTPGLPIRLNGSSGNFVEVVLGSRSCYDWIDSSPSRSINNSGAPPQNNTGQLSSVDPPTITADLNLPAFTVQPVNSACYSVMYHGHNAIFDQFVTTGDLKPIGRLTLTVEWHFKSPIWNSRFTQGVNV
jgi:hypothetical protein